MNDNYDRVFIAIKTECDRQRHLAEISCFDKIADAAGVQAGRLPLYLSQLQEAGLIRYSLKDRYIHLTAAGRAKQLPADVSSPRETRTAAPGRNIESTSGAY